MPHHTSESRYLAQYMHYVNLMRQLYADYEHASSIVQQQVFIKMIHVFMQQLCCYPPATYVITTAAYRDPEVGGYPHVVPVAYDTNTTLWYFTPSDDIDDMQDLWVKQAQVYLAEPRKGDVVAECATTIVWSNFFLIDGARKHHTSGAWDLWSVSDLPGATSVRVDLQTIEPGTEPDATAAWIVYQRLRALQYRPPSGIIS